MLADALPRIVICCAYVLLSLAPAAQARTWIDAGDYGALRLQLPTDATPAESRAAAVFAQYWRESTGHPVSQEAPDAEAVSVWIGRAAEVFVDEKALAALGPDGVVLRTKRRLHGVPGKSHLLLCGEGTRGTLYAVYEFLEARLGIRWLSPETTHVPPAAARLETIDYRHTPPFAYRDVSFPSYVLHPDFAVVHRLNGFFSTAPESAGGRYSYVYGHAGYGHTFHLLVEPDEYFDTHPEYFSEVGGKRIREKTQLCLSNPEVLALVIARARAWLENALPEERVISVSQMDWGNPCTCDACAATDAIEGSHSGSLIHFVNQVAAALEVDYPDLLVDTFAYMYSRKPPLHVRPRHNVQVRLCTLECDFGKPLTARSNPLNGAFRSDLAGWAAITEHLQIWDYTQNWYAFQSPHPTLHGFAPNLRLFARHGIAGIFEQASLYSPGADFEHLKAYVIAKLLWNPELDARALRDEFLGLYYGAAAPYLAAYWDALEGRVREMRGPLTMYNTLEWLDYDLVVHCLDLIGQAQAAVDDPVLLNRLERAQLSIQWAALACPARVTPKADGYIIDRPPSLSYEAFWELLMAHEVTRVNDNPIDQIWQKLPPSAVPRHEETRIEKLRNETHEVWIAPDLGGAVVRFRELGSGVDLLRGIEGLAEYKGRIGSWYFSLGDESESFETPVTTRLQVVARGENEITMRQETGVGTVLDRRIRLAPDAPRLEVSLDYDYRGTERVSLLTSVRAQWHTHGEGAVELWADTDAGWRVRGMPEAMGMRDFTRVPVGENQSWGFRLPGKKAGIVCRYTGDAYGGSAVRHLPESDEVVLDSSPGLLHLDPGQRLTFGVSYTWISEPPG